MAHIQDILALYQKVDAAMRGEVKVGHILKGIGNDAFQLLVIRDFQGVADVIAECRRFQHVKHRRIPYNFTRLPNIVPSSCEAILTPLPWTTNEVAKIVRREVETMMPIGNYSRAGDEVSTLSISMVQTAIQR